MARTVARTRGSSLRQEPQQRNEQERGVQGVRAVPLHEDAALVDPVGADVGVDLVGDLAPLRGEVGLVVHPGQPGAAVEGDPAHELARREVLRLPADLPDAAVGLVPVLDGLLDLPLQHRPQCLGQLLARSRVQVDRVEHGAPHVVLALVVGGVPDAHRLRTLVPGQVGQLELVELLLAADPVHDLQVLVVPADVVDEGEEVVGLAVEAERVQAPERERAVADPCVAVVPVALAAGGLGQARRGRREQGTGRRVGQALEGERAALQVGAPRVVGEDTLRDPLAPELLRPPQLVGRDLPRRRRGQGGPGQRDERLVPVDHARACRRRPAVDAEPQAAGQAQRRAVLRSRRGSCCSRRCRTPTASHRGRSPARDRTRPAGPPCR